MSNGGGGGLKEKEKKKRIKWNGNERIKKGEENEDYRNTQNRAGGPA